MDESVILNTPLLWILYLLALIFCLFDRKNQATKGAFTALSAFLTVVASAVALILGADMVEVIIVLLSFLLLGLEGWK